MSNLAGDHEGVDDNGDVVLPGADDALPRNGYRKPGTPRTEIINIPRRNGPKFPIEHWSVEQPFDSSEFLRHRGPWTPPPQSRRNQKD